MSTPDNVGLILASVTTLAGVLPFTHLFGYAA